MRVGLLAAAVGLLFACTPSVENNICTTTCRDLIQTCDYAAFPTLDSCVQGCNYDLENGADMPAEVQCFTDAQCDTFKIVECAHAYGPQ